jgi:electron transfer flavoprotein alpha subunit
MTKALVWVEHDGSAVKDATLSAVSAAAQGEVTLLVAGAGVDGVAQAAARIAGVAKVVTADDASLANALAENVAPLVAGLMADYDAFVAPATTTGKNVAPRVAALLDVMRSRTFSRWKGRRRSRGRSTRATPLPRWRAATPSW